MDDVIDSSLCISMIRRPTSTLLDTKELFTWRKEDPSNRKILRGGSILRWVYMQRFWSVRCPNGECLRRNLKWRATKTKKKIWTLMLSLLALTTFFQQNYHNNQLVVTPNEMVGLYYRD